MRDSQLTKRDYYDQRYPCKDLFMFSQNKAYIIYKFTFPKNYSVQRMDPSNF